jgi:hypothetical protein
LTVYEDPAYVMPSDWTTLVRALRRTPRNKRRFNVRKFSSRSLALLVALAALAALVVTAGAGATVGKKSASVQVCVLLPDTKSSVRWVQFDAPAMKAAFA